MFEILVTCVADDEVRLFEVICYRVLKPKHLQTDVWTAPGSWNVRSSPDLKNQTLISASPQSLGSKEVNMSIRNTSDLCLYLFHNVGWMKTTMENALMYLCHMTHPVKGLGMRNTRSTRSNNNSSPERSLTTWCPQWAHRSWWCPQLQTQSSWLTATRVRNHVFEKASIAFFQTHLKGHCFSLFIFLWAQRFNAIPTYFLERHFPHYTYAH